VVAAVPILPAVQVDREQGAQETSLRQAGELVAQVLALQPVRVEVVAVAQRALPATGQTVTPSQVRLAELVETIQVWQVQRAMVETVEITALQMLNLGLHQEVVAEVVETTEELPRLVRLVA